MQLTEHFSLEELIASEMASRLGINNTPPPSVCISLLILAQGLEEVRTLLISPIHVNSGYRSKQLNQVVGGSKTSDHIIGLAADIICPTFGKPLEICRAIAASNIPFKQVIHEFGHWCHISFALPHEEAKRELLTIASVATGYQEGLLTV